MYPRLDVKQGRGNKLMDQIFEKFMSELRAEKGPEENTVTSLCKNPEPVRREADNKHRSRPSIYHGKATARLFVTELKPPRFVRHAHFDLMERVFWYLHALLL